jgi:hypothetical protein
MLMDSSTRLPDLILRAPLDEIAGYLDALDPAARVAAIQGLGRGAQVALWKKADRDIGIEHFVPAGTPARREVIHEGRNTLPLPRLFRLFQKRFCLPEGEGGRTFGYNHGATMGVIGPGFFVGYPTAGKGDVWTERGAFVIDYFQVPDGAVVDGWPTVVPNSKGLQVLVYNGTRDFMRKVSAHVSIGAAFKGERALGQYFLLCRQG